MNPLYPAVAARAGHRCEYCHAPESVFNFRFEVEHIVPTSTGGAEAQSNLALSCRSCNLHKGSRLLVNDPESLAEIPLFDPRAGRWEDHFLADRKTGLVLGITSTGRGTVESLAINSVAQVLARQQWMRLGLFP